MQRFTQVKSTKMYLSIFAGNDTQCFCDNIQFIVQSNVRPGPGFEVTFRTLEVLVSVEFVGSL